MADQSVRKAAGVLEDVVVRVGKLVVPADFLVIDVSQVPKHREDYSLLLGRPFLYTAKAIINMEEGTVALRAGEESVTLLVRDVPLTPLAALVDEEIRDEPAGVGHLVDTIDKGKSEDHIGGQTFELSVGREGRDPSLPLKAAKLD